MSDGPKDKNIILDLDGTLIDSICIEDSEVPETSNDAQKLAEISKMVASEWGPASALVDTGTGVEAIFKRPGVDEFLDFCFRNFRNVGIWTHSNKEWVDLVLEHAFQQHPADSFAFIFTWDSRPETDSITDGNRTSCSNSRSRQQAEHVGDGKESIEQAAAEGLPTRLTKDLRIIFESEEWRSAGFAACNTIIVEDTPSNCKLTPENALTVNSFDVVSHRGRLATADSSRNRSASSCDPWRDDVLTRVQAVLQHPDVLGAADVRSLLGVHVVASSTFGAARRGLLCAGLRPVRRQIPAQPHMLPHATSS